MKHKPMSQVEAMRSVRKVWGFKPVSRVVPNKKKYQRHEKYRRGED